MIKIMDELMDMITSDESPSHISDKIKDLLFAKASERVDSFKPQVADFLFSGETEEENNEDYEE